MRELSFFNAKKTSIHIYIYAYIYVHIHVCVPVCLCVCVCTRGSSAVSNTHIFPCASVHPGLTVCAQNICMYVCMYVCIYVSMYLCVQIFESLNRPTARRAPGRGGHRRGRVWALGHTHVGEGKKQKGLSLRLTGDCMHRPGLVESSSKRTVEEECRKLFVMKFRRTCGRRHLEFQRFSPNGAYPCPGRG